VIDQASGATAYVTVRERAERGESLPPGWAIDARGEPTTDAAAALRGALLAFGGARGANIALMVEVLAAGLTGANWSLDAPGFDAGARSPGAGLFVLAIAPRLLATDFGERLEEQCARLERAGVYVPGRNGGAARVELPDGLVDALDFYAARAPRR
jgi:(2R)-3-sulfolactate dehydrogenase (NADP+)